MLVYEHDEYLILKVLMDFHVEDFQCFVLFHTDKNKNHNYYKNKNTEQNTYN